MRKPKTIGKLVDEAAVVLQKLRRMEEADPNGFCRCVTCGRVDHWKNMDGGHFISRTYTAHKLNPENIHPQCKGCNRFGNRCHDDYAVFMLGLLGKDRLEAMVAGKRATKRYSRLELEEMIADLKVKIKQLENR